MKEKAHIRKQELRVLKALLSDCKRSDREIAKRVGISQPTVSRVRGKLLSRGIIKSYEIMLDLAKLGFEILAFSTMEPTEKVKEDNEVVYATNLGPSSKMYTVSVHRKYVDYSNFCRRYRVDSNSSFLVPTSVEPTKPLSFKSIPF